jgi:hypothetical protein
MWPVARRRRAVSPPFYNSYDSLDFYRNYPSYDAISPAYSYNYGLGFNALGMPDYVPPTKAIENATRAHVTAQKEFEKAKEKYEEAKKKMNELEEKMKAAEEMLRAAKYSAMYGS